MQKLDLSQKIYEDYSANKSIRKFIKHFWIIFSVIIITSLSFLVWKENAHAEELNDIGANHEWIFVNVRSIGSYTWEQVLDFEAGTQYYDGNFVTPAHARASYITGLNNFILERFAFSFDMSELPEGAYITGAKIYTPDEYGGSSSNQSFKVGLFPFIPLSTGNSAYSDFGSTLLSTEYTITLGTPSANTEYYELNEDGIEYLQNEFENSSTTVKLGIRNSFDYERFTPNSGQEYFAGLSDPTTIDITYTMEEPEPVRPVTITNPSPYQSQETIIVNSQTQVETISGTCSADGEYNILVSWRQTNFIPTTEDFDDDVVGGQTAINCESGIWSYDYPLVNWWYPDGSGVHNITVFSNEFIIEERDFVNGFDSAFVSFTAQNIMSFDPDYLLPINIPSDSEYTCATLPPFFEATEELPYFRINEFQKRISCIFIDENFFSNVEIMKRNQEVIYTNKIPFAYYYKVTDLWDNRSTTTNTKITLNLTDNPKIPTSSPLKGINHEFLDAEDLQYDNLPDGLKDVADFMEDRLVPVIFASFIIWLAIRVASSISA